MQWVDHFARYKDHSTTLHCGLWIVNDKHQAPKTLFISVNLGWKLQDLIVVYYKIGINIHFWWFHGQLHLFWGKEKVQSVWSESDFGHLIWHGLSTKPPRLRLLNALNTMSVLKTFNFWSTISNALNMPDLECCLSCCMSAAWGPSQGSFSSNQNSKCPSCLHMTLEMLFSPSNTLNLAS